MKHTGNLLIVALLFLVSCQQKAEQQVQSMYSFPEQTQSRWISFENPQGEKGKGGMENFGAKGHPQDSIGAGATQVLMDIKGSGVINRMWVTINDRSPEMLRSLRIDMYWDGESKPAVSAPFGDFFGIGLGRMTAFENALFADPEGRSFVSYIRMPFKTGAKITLTNESDQPVSALFYDIDYLLTPWKKDNLYFHCYWNRDTATTRRLYHTSRCIGQRPLPGDQHRGKCQPGLRRFVVGRRRSENVPRRRHEISDAGRNRNRRLHWYGMGTGPIHYAVLRL
jgi:hypothetical protein